MCARPRVRSLGAPGGGRAWDEGHSPPPPMGCVCAHRVAANSRVQGTGAGAGIDPVRSGQPGATPASGTAQLNYPGAGVRCDSPPAGSGLPSTACCAMLLKPVCSGG
jgi:hypothetical protein